MKKVLLSLLGSINILFLIAQGGYNIKITLKPVKNQKIYLGYYYGKMKALADSAMLNGNSTGNFTGKDPLNGGIYFIVSPQKQVLFEILIDKNQNFSIIADTAKLPGGVTFIGSSDNNLFQSYTVFANQTGKAIAAVSRQYATSKKGKDSAAVAAKIKALSDKMQRYRDSVGKKHPNSFLTVLFNALREPVVPPALKHPGGKYDSLFAYNYYKSHYWDGISFSDGRLVRTPFFEPKLEKFYKDLVVPHPDSIRKEVDAMLLYARTDKEMYKFLLVHFVQKYINPEYMGQDAVFVHLFEKYINTGKADFFTEQYKEFMIKRAYSLMANLIGQPAANMEMVDTLERPLPLYNVSADFIVICFWDPTCGHCKEVIPSVDSIYDAKWKDEGVKIYGVKVDGSKEEWLSFIHQHHLKDWIHVYQLPSQQSAETESGKPGFRQLYDVYQTPILYLLDKDKRIIAKKLTYIQMDEVLKLKLKNPKS